MERERSSAIPLISIELEETLALSDRIIGLLKGEILGQFPANDVDTQEIRALMVGSKRKSVWKHRKILYDCLI